MTDRPLSLEEKWVKDAEFYESMSDEEAAKSLELSLEDYKFYKEHTFEIIRFAEPGKFNKAIDMIEHYKAKNKI
ncbi:hypothetical protein [Lactococcus termiticola]|uniref:Uncharacterized protein n=1 Tax=Lactococcus termiticola TaxID=2169526 RepID=A0A2R5HF45_9LACT|nr:hypothetical protein [Lactococcus termiticola]GBG96673.1 hypothetical protein NtB2_00797 [Lactococcus termiticola]